MICPYCKRDIDDHAVVCAHCQSDLRLYTPIDGRSSRAERKVVFLFESVGPIEVGAGSAVVLSVVLSFLFDYISWQPFASRPKDIPFQWLAVLSPVFGGILLGAFRNRLTKLGFILNGAIAGIGGFAAHILVWSLGALQSAHNQCVVGLNRGLSDEFSKYCAAAPSLPKYWYVSALTYSASGVLLFLSGNILGRRFGTKPATKWDDKEMDEPGKGWEPIVTAIGALLAAVLSKALNGLG